ncbi:MAG: hypothetical protein JWM04_2744 [Verrucomicrobiales bacterium]|nr:hypothetical protein [Verrucomicrobiales bacterium]
MRRNLGFSLVEVMIAILILGVALTGLTMGITTALRSSKESELQTAAALIAAGQVELLRADGLIIDGETEGETEGMELYKWRQTVSPSTLDGLHEVEVKIEDPKTGKEIYSLKTMLFDPPLEETPGKTNTKESDKKKKRQRGRA